MNFVTIHDLSRELNIPERVVRYRFHQLRTAGKLIENEDFIRDDYVDDQHFTWKINPLSYMRETKSSVAPPVEFPTFTVPSDFGNHGGNQPVNKEVPLGYQSVNQRSEVVNHDGNQAEENPPSNPGREKSDPSFEREMIVILRDRLTATDRQLEAKDIQITNLAQQNHELNDLNIRLVGQGIRQSEQIQELLKIASPTGNQNPMRGEPVDTKVNDSVNTDEDVGNQDFDFGYQYSDEENIAHDWLPDDMPV